MHGGGEKYESSVNNPLTRYDFAVENNSSKF